MGLGLIFPPRLPETAHIKQFKREMSSMLLIKLINAGLTLFSNGGRGGQNHQTAYQSKVMQH